MQDRGVQVMNVQGILRDVVSKFVGRSVDRPRFDSTTGHPNAEALRMMITTKVIGSQLALAIVGSAELAAPDDQRIIQ